MGVEAKLKTLDIQKTLGEVTLSDGGKLPVPKLSMLKIIQIVKFLGVDGAKIYSQAREVLIDDSYDQIEKYAVILESIQEEQVMHIFSIILEIEDKESLSLDMNESLDVLLVLAENLDFEKTFTQVRQLMKKLFNKELPDFKELIDRAFPEVPMEPVKEETSEKTEEVQEEATA
ncbi:hypothetical protein FA002_02140 [Priestia megaterium]|uniref:hypothetical protein n=1 Tax=Priestia megaterium TaxID=1404 RepID=UPI0010ACFFAF|nr:hypothetical protein [Priestia megaterium]TJZ40392.1 hypothetical protein FA002_02140 [Priestia megaterium]